MFSVAVLRYCANWRSSSEGRAFCYDIDISLCGLLVGEVNERLIVRAACNETKCLWAVSWPQSEYSRALKHVRHFTAVENWDVVLNVFDKLRYIYTHIHPYIYVIGQ